MKIEEGIEYIYIYIERIKGEKEMKAYKSIAFRSPSGLVSDDYSLQDLTKLLKVLLHGILLGFPC